ncbi:MAG: TIGR03000 domain-containing protein [Fimbriiglobus sp.]
MMVSSWLRASAWLVLVLSVMAVTTKGTRAQEKKEEVKKAKLTVVVPLEDAVLTIEGKMTKATGTERKFDLPSLEAGKQYEYKFSVEWRPNNYTIMTRPKTVVFKGGEDLKVDLTVEDPNDQAVIRYVPTPDDITAEMIKLAKITKDDVVFEPGCGDSRITIAAVKAGAKKGVGIDLDPERITESKANIKTAKLEDKIEARLGNALEIKDFDQATVVFLYMGNEFNKLIRPNLWKQLKVGTRIVSHRFTMDDWKPDETKKIMGADGDEYEIHLWTITEEIKKKIEKK